MQVLHVYKDYDPPIHGGMERHLALMCRHQRQWGEVRALVCGRRLFARQVARAGVPVTEAGELGRFQSAPFSPSFPLHLWRLRSDVLVIHTPNPTAEISTLLAARGAALVVRYQSDVVRQANAMRLYRPFQMKFLRKADMILVASPQYLEQSETLAPFREKCRVVPLGIEAEAFAQADPARVAALRERYGDRFVLFSGMHRYYKGLRYLVEAAPRIDAPVVIAGEGPERAALMQQAEALGVHVHFPGALDDDDLVAHLHAGAVFAFPSCERSEAYGLSMLEAHACGKPVVATRLGTGVEYVNVHEETGLNVPPRDAEALAEALNALLADPARREALGAHARERVRRDFDAAAVARREWELYEEALACRSTRT